MDMKIVRSAAVIVIMLGVVSWGLSAILSIDGMSFLSGRMVYFVGGFAVVVCLAIFALGGTHGISDMLGRLGGSSGDNRGPAPGDGAVIHHSSGESDFDGLSGNALPPVKSGERNQPYAPSRSAD
jgi:hypothetical protein